MTVLFGQNIEPNQRVPKSFVSYDLVVCGLQKSSEVASGQPTGYRTQFIDGAKIRRSKGSHMAKDKHLTTHQYREKL